MCKDSSVEPGQTSIPPGPKISVRVLVYGTDKYELKSMFNRVIGEVV